MDHCFRLACYLCLLWLFELNDTCWGFSSEKLLFSPFVISRHFVERYFKTIQIPHSSSHFLSIYIFIQCGLMVSYFIQWVIIYCYNYLFQCSNYPRFAHWKSLQNGFCVLLTYLYYSLSTSLLSGAIRSSKLLYFPCPVPDITCYFKKPWTSGARYLEVRVWRLVVLPGMGYCCSEVLSENRARKYLSSYLHI